MLKAEWIKNISLGICTEEVGEKGMPSTAAGIKTFSTVHSYEQLEKHIRLCIMDVNVKMSGYMEDQKIFPT